MVPGVDIKVNLLRFLVSCLRLHHFWVKGASSSRAERLETLILYVIFFSEELC